MTLNTTYNPTVADGNGTTKEFSYNFNPLAREYLKVSFQINNEWVEQKSGWSATVSENGGVVTFDIAPTTRVAIERDVPEEQPTQYKTSSGFQAEVIEHSFDLLTGMVQELRDETSRSVKVDIGSDISPDKIVAQVERVYDSIDNIDTVGMDKDNVDAVATNISKVDTIANNINDVKTVADNINDVKTVSKNIENVNTVATDIMDVVTVAGITEQTKNVSDNMYAVEDVSDNMSAVVDVSHNKSNINNVSKNMADVKKAVQSANDAKLWAVGTKTEKPEGSSKYWAEQAKQAAQVYDATETVKGIVRLATSDEVTAGTNDSTAITPLKFKSKLDTKQDKSTAVNYNNISNCITYIPQDIKLELNNGTLTLKSGSKVYMPNGIYPATGKGKFELVSIDSDITTIGFNDGQIMVLAQCSSLNSTSITSLGDTLVTNTYTYSNTGSSTNGMVYLNTSNFIYFYENGTRKYRFGLPLAICTRTNGKITSIDQVFNGFGYIGSTVFALPGVKGLIPNGRNEDGSLKNLLSINNSVNIYTLLSSETEENIPIYVQQNGSIFRAINHIYDEKNNFNLNFGDINSCYVGSYVSYTNGRITSFTPKTVFHALDYNDKSTISGWSMPSSRYIDLTLGASGSTYTAPANGHFFIHKVAGIATAYINFINKTNNTAINSNTTDKGYSSRMILPVRKGDVVKCEYNSTGETIYFRFIYAEGSK